MEPRNILVCDDEELAGQLLMNLRFINIKTDMVYDFRSFAENKFSGEPRIIILALPPGITSVTQLVDSVRRISDSGEIILVAEDISMETVKEAMRAGVVDVVKIPEELKNLELSVSKATENFQKMPFITADKEEQLQVQGQIYTVYSAKGGAGKTFTAVNLAQALKVKTGGKVLLVDFNLQFGGVQYFLDLPEAKSIFDLLPVINELNINHINNVKSWLEPTGVDILLAPADPEKASHFDGDKLELLLAALPHYYDYVVVDHPSELNVAGISALEKADHILYVVTPDSPSLYAMKASFNIFKGYQLPKKGQISVVVNRESNKNDININDIAALSDYPVIAQIRSDFQTVQSFVNIGKPLFGNSKDKSMSKLARDFLQMAEKICPEVL